MDKPGKSFKKNKIEAGKRRGGNQDNPSKLLKTNVIDHKNIKLLKEFLNENDKLLPRRITKVSAKQQTRIASAVKRARFIGLLPYSDIHKINN